MDGDRLARILAAMLADADGKWSAVRLCESARNEVGMSGAGVMLMSGDLPTGTLCTTDHVSNRIEELQYTLGEGPCVDAFRHGVVVLEPDLNRPTAARWPAFTAPAVDAGARAVFGFPLQVGTARLGALNLYRDTPGPLTDTQHSDALVMADVITRWVLTVQAEAPAGAVAKCLEDEGDFHFVVHNAAGAVSVQLGISVTEALIRLRAHAFSSNRSIDEIAEDIVARRLRF